MAERRTTVRENRRRIAAKKAKEAAVGLRSEPHTTGTMTVKVGPVTPLADGEMPETGFLKGEQSAECCFCRRDPQPCVVGARVAWGAMLPTICADCASWAFLKLHGAKL